MHVLALDTTTRDGSAALVANDRVIEERRGDPARSQAERLPGELVAVAAAHGLAVNAVDLFAVAAGPGSFTGLRIGIATVQGLALVTRRPVAAISALEALAHAVSVDLPVGTVVAAWMDGRRHTVFAALYRVADAPVFSSARLVELDGPSVDAPAAILDRWADAFVGREVVFTGDGAVLHAALLDAPGRGWRTVAPPLIAGAIGRIAAARARAGNVLGAEGIRPLYVRRPDVELARETRGHVREPAVPATRDGRLDD